MYPSEFGSDAPGYEAVEPDVLFSLTPTLLALFALALLAAVVVGWLAGRGAPERTSDGARRIYEEIEDAVKDAVKAPQRQVADRAAKLHGAIRKASVNQARSSETTTRRPSRPDLSEASFMP